MKTTYDWTDDCYSGLEKIDPQYERFFNIIKELNECSERAVSRRLRTEMILEWRDEYNVGVKEIDSQHRVFFRIVTRLSDLQASGAAQVDEVTQLGALLDELQVFTQLHFKTEEDLMAQYGYPMIHHRKKEHEIIVSELDRQIKAIKRSDGSVVKLVYFLVQWFIKHTVYSDRDVGVFIRQQRKNEVFGVNLKGVIQKITGTFASQPQVALEDESGSVYSAG